MRDSARRRWHESELESLKAEIVALRMDGGGLGRKESDKLLREWTPSVFA